MADEKQLQDNQGQVGDILARLRGLAGPRGATYAGRVLTPQDTPQSIMGRTPGGDTEEYGTMALPAAGAVGAGITKAQLKAGVRPQTQIEAAMERANAAQRISKAELQAGVRPASRGIQFFEAPKGVEPSIPFHQLGAAVKRLDTGEIISAGKRGVEALNSGLAHHEGIRKLIPEGVLVEEGFVDPTTMYYYSRAALDKISQAFSDLLSRTDPAALAARYRK
jgi:hypothetical protein